MIATDATQSAPRDSIRIAVAAAMSIAFGLSYGILPLFSSNQNHHFLIGLARAGLGSLNDDWLTQTADPFPLFTAYVVFVHRYLADALHYVVYFALFGLYGYALVRITEDVWPPRAPGARAERLAFVAALCVLHNETIGYLLGFGRAHLAWWQMFHWGVAEQEIFGHGAFQASSFGMLLPMAIALFLRGRPAAAAALAGGVVAVHFSYALTAAALVVAFIIGERAHPRRALLTGLAAVVPAGVAAVDVWIRLGPTSGAASTAAAAVLVRHLPQEANAATWLGPRTIVQVLGIAIGVWLVRRSRLFVVLSVPCASALALTAIQIATKNAQLALLFPWRPSVLLVPVTTALIARRAVHLVTRRASAARLESLTRASLTAIVVSTLVGGVRTGLHFAYFYGDGRVTAVTDRFVPERWRRDFAATLEAGALPMIRFVRSSARPGDLYVIPPELERFRVTAGAAALADFKSHPYKDVEVLEWRRRLDQAIAVYASGGECRTLARTIETYGVSHVIADSRIGRFFCDSTVKTYEDDRFAVYRIDRSDRARVVQ